MKTKKEDKSTKDVSYKWQNTNVKKRHLKKAGNAHKNIFNSANANNELLSIVTSVAKKIRDIGKKDIDEEPENHNE